MKSIRKSPALKKDNQSNKIVDKLHLLNRNRMDNILLKKSKLILKFINRNQKLESLTNKNKVRSKVKHKKRSKINKSLIN